MSVKRWALSVFFVWHLVVTGLGSLAVSDPLPPIEAAPPVATPAGESSPPVHDLIVATLRPVLDTVAATVMPFPGAVARAAAPLSRPAAFYREITGNSQNWKMFSSAPKTHQYLRVRYYVGPRDVGGNHGAWTATELVLPAHREDQMRLVRAYRDSYRDKAMTVALGRFHRRRDEDLVKPDTTSAELPDDIAPIGRYFARRFERRALGPDERIVRTEIWYGIAPMALPGGTLDPAIVDARMATLRRYYEAPVENRFRRPVHPAYHALEEEAGITWILEYFEP
jgi:hypothetical protein